MDSRSRERKELRDQLKALPRNVLLRHLAASHISLSRTVRLFKDLPVPWPGYFECPNGYQRPVRDMKDDKVVRQAIVRMLMNPPPKACRDTFQGPALEPTRIGTL